METFTINIESLGKVSTGICNQETYPEANKLYLLNDGTCQHIGYRNAEGCTWAFPLPLNIIQAHLISETVSGIQQEEREQFLNRLGELGEQIIQAVVGAVAQTPPVQERKGITEDTLLKAIALSQDPNLIKDIND